LKGTYFRVGLLLLIGIGGAIGLVLFLGRDTVRDGVPYETYFRESVQGLEVGAGVKYRGVQLGQVKEIGLVSAAYLRDMPPDPQRQATRQVFVRFVLDPKKLGRMPDEETAIRYGLRARLASQGITGLAYLELDFVDPARFPAEKVPWTPLYTYLPSMPSTYTQVQDAAQALLQKLETVDLTRLVDSVQAVLDDVHGQLSTGDTHAALADAAALMKGLRGDVAGADIGGLLKELRATVEDAHATIAALRGTFDGKATKNLLASGTQAADQLAAATAKLPPLIAALEAATRRTDAGVSDVQAGLIPVLRDARAAAANLRETSETLRRYPAGSLFGGPPPRGQGDGK
jgi:paraquat-inducible protein B